jgi:SAM-dependent methyltransferase
MTEPRSPLETHLRDQAERNEFSERFFWHRLRSEFVVEAIRKHARSDAKVVDIGAGAGIFGVHLSQALPLSRYAFAEPIDELAERLARTHGPECDWTRRAHFQEADVAVLLDVVEHQADDIAFLRDVTSKLRPGALLVLTAPALPALWSRWDEALGHHRRYLSSELVSVAERSGASVLASRYLFPALTLPALLRKYRPPEGTEFPALPRIANEIAYLAGRAGRLLVERAPLGSSVAVVALRR